MRNAIAVIMSLMAIALIVCAQISKRSTKDIAPKVTHFLYSLLPPVIGNLLIIVGRTEGISLFGRYLYACGIDITMYCLLDFTLQYCGLNWHKSFHKILITLISLDIIQLLCNLLWGHAFSPKLRMAYGEPYYDVVSHWGRNLHLGLVYVIMGIVLGILLIKIIRGARIFSEKYSIMFILLILTGAWEMFYLLSHTPVKTTVIVYGVFGLLVFYFSLYYRPMRLLDRLLGNVASGLTDGLFFFDDNGRCIWADEHGLKLTGLKENELVRCESRLNAMFPGLELAKNDWQCQRQYRNRHYNLVKHAMVSSRQHVLGSVLSVQDDTDKELELQKERYAATHDPLTGLYRKEYLFRCIRERIDSNPDTTFYIAYMDINNFKLINDVFGKSFGDYTLKSIAANLQQNLPKDALYGRLSGDTFGFCFSGDTFNPEHAEKYCSEFLIEEGPVSHRVVIHEGVYEVTERNIDVSVMFDRAHIALMTIKNDYKKHIALYDNRMRAKMLLDQDLTLQLPNALKTGQIRPYLQAIVDINSKIIGAEALVRWIHPVKGFLSPASFIPTLEHNGLIADVDRYMWRCSCEILKRWEKMGYDDLFISINVSPTDFYFMDVKEVLKNTVREFDISPSRLRVEITESVMMNDDIDKFEILKDLQSSGFIVEMDDFGSGYSSLNMLKNMPVDVIKLDMMFVNDMNNVSRTSTILRNVINMMVELGLTPLTEGIETKEQYDILSRMGCKMFQGYLFAKPMPVEDFEREFLKERDCIESSSK